MNPVDVRLAIAVELIRADRIGRGAAMLSADIKVLSEAVLGYDPTPPEGTPSTASASTPGAGGDDGRK